MIKSYRNSFFIILMIFLLAVSSCSPPSPANDFDTETSPTTPSAPPPTAVVTPTLTLTPAALPTTTPTPIPYEELIQIKGEIGTRIDRMVFAVYQAWFGSSKWTDWNHWEWESSTNAGHNPESIFANGRRDIASVFYPLIGPYDSSDTNLIEYHIEFAQAIGIDAFIVDWYGPYDLPTTDLNFQNANFGIMLDIAMDHDFPLAVLYEPKIHYIGWIPHISRDETIQAIIKDLEYVLTRLSNHQAYLTVDGLPLIFVFDAIGLSANEWQFVVEELESKGHAFALVGDLPRSSYYGPFSGLWGWLNYSALVYYDYETRPDIWEAQNNRTLSSASRGEPDRFFCAGVWPGFDDTGVNAWGDGARVLDRLEGQFYDMTWEEALVSNPDCVFIMTYNDWNEGTIIEPSVEFGYEYAVATLSFIEAYKGIDLDDSRLMSITERYLDSLE